MSKVTSKFQVTLPRKIARAHQIEPGSELTFVSSGDSLRVIVQPVITRKEEPLEAALASFDETTRRQAVRNAALLAKLGDRASCGRDWTREELYASRLDPR